MSQVLQKFGEVFLPVEIVAAFGRVMHIPGNLFKFVKGCEKIGRLAKR